MLNAAVAGVCVRHELVGSRGVPVRLPAVPEGAPGIWKSPARASDRTACIPTVLQPIPLTKDQPLVQEADDFPASSDVAQLV